MKHTAELQYGPRAEKTIWGKSRKYTRRQMLKVPAGRMMNHHMVAVAPHHEARWYFQHLPPLAFSALPPCCKFCLWPMIYWAGWAQESIVFLHKTVSTLSPEWSTTPAMLLQDSRPRKAHLIGGTRYIYIYIYTVKVRFYGQQAWN